MAKEQMRPASNKQAPDPAHSYERTDPKREAGMGRMNSIKATPTDRPDHPEEAVSNKQESRQINADEVTDARSSSPPTEQPEQPDHSMHDEEPLGWDQAPTDIHDPRHKRHPRKEGKGGLE